MESSCPVTGSRVRLTVNPSGFSDLHPEELWVSFPAPATTSTADITGTFCCHVHFLAGRSAADDWLTIHAGATALTLPDAFELGRLAIRCCAAVTTSDELPRTPFAGIRNSRASSGGWKS